jgi:S-(hydroxymethyl)glutathione dehydrogenase / alcohol dehydrogenase
MRAAVLESFNSDLVEQSIELDAPAPDEVLVQVVASGLCHSDRSVHLGAQDRPLPLVLGHEASGVVTRVGAAVTGLRKGDHVVGSAAAFCGVCSQCLRGRPQHCTDKGNARASGEPRMTGSGRAVHAFVGLGGFATHMLVSERAVTRIPDEMPLEVAALLGCAVLTGLGAVRHRARVGIGDVVVVIGCGGVGLNAIQGARLAGASQIIAIDLNAAKLDRALQFGATTVVNAAQADPVDAVLHLTGGGAAHALEVVGRPETIQQAYAMVGVGGTVTVVGVTRPDDQIQLPAISMMSEKRIQGSRMGSSNFRVDVPLYCDMYLRGQLMLDELISERIELSGVNGGLARLDGSDGARSVIRFD